LLLYVDFSIYLPKIIEFYGRIEMLQAKMKGGIVFNVAHPVCVNGEQTGRGVVSSTSSAQSEAAAAE